MKASTFASSKTPLKFRIPKGETLVPIRLDIDIDGKRFKDAFSWNPAGKFSNPCRNICRASADEKRRRSAVYFLLQPGCSNQYQCPFCSGIFKENPDSEVVVFAKRTVKDLKLPPAFITQIAQSIQSQLTEFRSLDGQEMYAGEKLVVIKLDLRVNNMLIRDKFLWDLNNSEGDPEEFARTFCRDLNIRDSEVGPAIAQAIREQLYEIAVQNATSARESRMSKKGRRGFEHALASKSGSMAVDMVKLFGPKYSVIRKRKDWDQYEPIVDILSNEEVDALEAREYALKT